MIGQQNTNGFIGDYCDGMKYSTILQIILQYKYFYISMNWQKEQNTK